MRRFLSPKVFNFCQIGRRTKARSLVTGSGNSGNDTIFALSSGAEGVSGVAIIRISGPKARYCLESLTKKAVSFPQPRVASVRHLIDPTTQEVLDHAMVLWFPSPRSYTGEDVCELHVHGSRAVIKGVFASLTDLSELALLKNDSDMNDHHHHHHHIRLAERGEFTKRAFENGRLDLTEAEGLGDLLVADTSAQRKQALRQMEGHMRRTYESWRDELKSCLAHCEAVIDFGDDDRENDIDDRDMWVLSPRVKTLCAELKGHLDDKHRGEIIRDGVRVALIGPPNAGKSSLLNMLARRPAAIVSPMAGTTRDVVEVRMEFDGISCILSDTAGMRINTDKDNKYDGDGDGDGTHNRNEQAGGSSAVTTANATAFSRTEDDIFCSTDAIEYEGMRRARDVYLASHVKVLICDASDAVSVSNTLSLLDTLQAMHPPQDQNDQLLNDANITDPDNLLPFIPNITPVRDGNGVRDQLSQTFVIFNKTDLLHDRSCTDATIRNLTLEKKLPSSAINFLSCSTGAGLQELEASLSSVIKDLISGDDKTSSGNSRLGEGELITRTRHRTHVLQCVRHLETFLEEDLLMDTAAEELRLAMSELGKLTGRVEVEDLLDVIFRDFCIGK